MREVWRQAHLKQPLGSRDGSHIRQRGGSDLKSTTGGSRGAPPPLIAPGGFYIEGGIRDPISPTRGTSSRARPLSVAEPGRSMPRAGTLAPAAAPAPSFSAT